MSDPTDPATPADTNFAKVAAEHLRDIKTYLQTQVGRIAALENAAQKNTGRVAGLKGPPYLTRAASSAITGISAKEIVARNAAGGTIVFSGATALQVDLAVGPGPVINGRDQSGNFVVNDEVHIFAIFDTAGATPKLIASLSSSLPALPAGYVYWCYLFSAVLSGTNQFPVLTVQGCRVYHSTGSQIRSGAIDTTEWYNDKTALRIPDIANKKFFEIGSVGDSTLATYGLADGDGVGSHYVESGSVPNEGFTLFSLPHLVELPKVGSHTGIFGVNLSALTVLNNGYTVPNGDV